MAKNRTGGKSSTGGNDNGQGIENLYEVLEPHKSKVCIQRYSAKMGNKCKTWDYRDFIAGEKVKSLIIDNGELVIIEEGDGHKIPIEKTVLIRANEFGIPMEEVTSKPIKTGIRLTYNEIILLIFLGLVLIGTGILTFRGVKKVDPEYLQIKN